MMDLLIGLGVAYVAFVANLLRLAWPVAQDIMRGPPRLLAKAVAEHNRAVDEHDQRLEGIVAAIRQEREEEWAWQPPDPAEVRRYGSPFSDGG